MDANSGEPWSEINIIDLTNEIAHGRTVAQNATSFGVNRTRSATK